MLTSVRALMGLAALCLLLPTPAAARPPQDGASDGSPTAPQREHRALQRWLGYGSVTGHI